MKKTTLNQIIFPLIFAAVPLGAMEKKTLAINNNKIKVYCDSTSRYSKLVASYQTSPTSNQNTERVTSPTFELVSSKDQVSRKTLVVAYGENLVDVVENNKGVIAAGMFNSYWAAMNPESYLAPLRRKVEHTHKACQSAIQDHCSLHLGGALGTELYDDLIVAQVNAITDQSKNPAVILKSHVGLKNNSKSELAPWLPRYYETNKQVTQDYFNELSKETSLVIYKIQDIKDIADTILALPIEEDLGASIFDSSSTTISNKNQQVERASLKVENTPLLKVLAKYCSALTADLGYLLSTNVPFAIIVPEPVEQTKESEQIVEEVTKCILNFVNEFTEKKQQTIEQEEQQRKQREQEEQQRKQEEQQRKQREQQEEQQRKQREQQRKQREQQEEQQRKQQEENERKENERKENERKQREQEEQQRKQEEQQRKQEEQQRKQREQQEEQQRKQQEENERKENERKQREQEEQQRKQEEQQRKQREQQEEQQRKQQEENERKENERKQREQEEQQRKQEEQQRKQREQQEEQQRKQQEENERKENERKQREQEEQQRKQREQQEQQRKQQEENERKENERKQREQQEKDRKENDGLTTDDNDLSKTVKIVKDNNEKKNV